MTKVIVEERDEVLVESFRATRDSQCFKILVGRYQNRLYNVAFKILESSGEAEEVVQETFVRVLRSLDKFKSYASFRAWIHTITHNLCIDILRARKRKREGEVREGNSKYVVTQVADHLPGPAEQLELLEQRKLLLKSLNHIPESQKIVIILHDIEGFSYKEIATITGAGLGTVRSRLYYARGKLRRLLKAASNQILLSKKWGD